MENNNEFKIPLNISKFYENIIPLRWSDCESMADHTHIFWVCPVLRQYWQSIKTEIEKIISVQLPTTLFILGTIADDICGV